MLLHTACWQLVDDGMRHYSQTSSWFPDKFFQSQQHNYAVLQSLGLYCCVTILKILFGVQEKSVAFTPSALVAGCIGCVGRVQSCLGNEGISHGCSNKTLFTGLVVGMRTWGSVNMTVNGWNYCGYIGDQKVEAGLPNETYQPMRLSL